MFLDCGRSPESPEETHIVVRLSKKKILLYFVWWFRGSRTEENLLPPRVELKVFVCCGEEAPLTAPRLPSEEKKVL